MLPLMTVVDQHAGYHNTIFEASSLTDRLFISVMTFTMLCSGVHEVYSVAGNKK